MNPEHRKILVNNRVYLKDNLYVSIEMLSYLRDDKIITEEHEEILMKECSTKVKRINYFMDLIVKRGQKAFECFLRSLILSNQLFVAKHLDHKLTEKILIDLQTPTENKCPMADMDFSDPKLIESLKSRFKDLDIKDPEVVESLKCLLQGYPEECGMPILKTVLTRIDFNDSNMLECFKPILKVLAFPNNSLERISTSSLLKRTNFQFNPKVKAYLVPLVEAALKEAPSRDEESKESLNEDKFLQGQVGPLTPSAPPAGSPLLNEFPKNGDVLLTPTAPSMSVPFDVQTNLPQVLKPGLLKLPSISVEDEDEPDKNLETRSFKNKNRITKAPLLA